MKENISIHMDGHVQIIDYDKKKVLVDKHNAIHPQNMARILARGLANEPNSIIYRMALGNGGSFIDAGSNIIINPPNDGSNGEGWESRLYNEIYSEVVDNESPLFRTDPGSAGPNSVRIGGGASPADDPPGGGVSSMEVGRKSNVIVQMFINRNEPSGQLETDSGPVIPEEEQTFYFDELGLYSPGKPARSTNGYTTVDVGNKTSENSVPIDLQDNTLILDIQVDGVTYATELTIPNAGTGPSGTVTFGDLCEGINTGTWVTGGDPINDHVFVYITDRTGGTYPSIVGKESYGFLTFESLSSGDGSSVDLNCNSGNSNDFINILTNGICGHANVVQQSGINAGVINDPANPENERERLLTHLTFSPVLKTESRSLLLVYTLTVSVVQTGDTIIDATTTTP